jgi:hypothetical protein
MNRGMPEWKLIAEPGSREPAPQDNPPDVHALIDISIVAPMPTAKAGDTSGI